MMLPAALPLLYTPSNNASFLGHGLWGTHRTANQVSSIKMGYSGLKKKSRIFLIASTFAY